MPATAEESRNSETKHNREISPGDALSENGGSYKGMQYLGKLLSDEHAPLLEQLPEQHSAPVNAMKPNLLKENLEV